MGKKIMCLLFVGLVVALVVPVGSAKTEYKAKLFVIGTIQIDNIEHEVRGFAFFGNINGELIYLQKYNVKFDGATPIFMGSVIPFLFHHVYYNPA
jgi:hypothetical protein